MLHYFKVLVLKLFSASYRFRKIFNTSLRVSHFTTDEETQRNTVSIR